MILIGPELEQALAAILCWCDSPIGWAVLDQIDFESRDNQVQPKQYILHDSKRIRLSAVVDAYEPEIARLQLDRGRCKQYASIIAAASTVGFGRHAYFLSRPFRPPRFITNAITPAHKPFASKRPILRTSLVAIDRLNAILRCSLGGTGIRPTSYWIYAVNVRTIAAHKLAADDAKPFAINGYR